MNFQLHIHVLIQLNFTHWITVGNLKNHFNLSKFQKK